MPANTLERKAPYSGKLSAGACAPIFADRYRRNLQSQCRYPPPVSPSNDGSDKMVRNGRIWLLSMSFPLLNMTERDLACEEPRCPAPGARSEPPVTLLCQAAHRPVNDALLTIVPSLSCRGMLARREPPETDESTATPPCTQLLSLHPEISPADSRESTKHNMSRIRFTSGKYTHLSPRIA